MPNLPGLLYPSDIMRERETKISEAAILLERAERLATSRPPAALPEIQKALRACHRVGVECLETRAFATLGAILLLLGRLGHAETAFRVAYRSECSCCRPVVDRLSAFLLDEQGRKPEAVARASRAVETARTQERGRALVTLGTVRFYAGDVSGSIEALTEALAALPVRSPHHRIAVANLANALAHSDKPEDVERAATELEGLPDRFKGLKRVSQERVKLAWITGQVLARLVHVHQLQGWAKKRHLTRAKKLLTETVSALERLGLVLDIAAARADLAAIQIQLDPLEVAVTLAGIPVKGEKAGKAFDISTALAAAKDAADVVFTLERKAQLFEALGALRAATVQAGACPPVMPYAVT